MKERLKRVLPGGWQRRLRRLSRLRWATKAGIVRHYGVRFRERPLVCAKYVLLDPEVDSFSYDIENGDELAELVARATGVDVADARGWVEETRTDTELNEGLARTVRWRFDFKRHLPLGPRVAWYVLARAIKPAVVVETGIQDGLGSLALLRALHHNAAEGSPGRLISFDTDEEAGWLVPERVRGSWTRVQGRTDDALEPAVRDLTIDLFIHDTPHTAEIQTHEFGVALAHASRRIAMIDGSGGQYPVLRELCERNGGTHLHFRERPRDHFYPAPGIGIGLFGYEVAATTAPEGVGKASPAPESGDEAGEAFSTPRARP